MFLAPAMFLASIMPLASSMRASLFATAAAPVMVMTMRQMLDRQNQCSGDQHQDHHDGEYPLHGLIQVKA